MVKNDKFKCENCGGIFAKGKSDEDAISEMKTEFGDLPPEDRAVVCDDCYVKITAFFAGEGDDVRE